MSVNFLEFHMHDMIQVPSFQGLTIVVYLGLNLFYSSGLIF